MLNIPDSVKTLFKQDGVRKNFRVHFPNGELPDITNDNVVQESVKFTESLCSQDVLKFGLTEASVIEFETVGIGNMYGMTIETGIEIDLSSLSAAELAEIEAGSWDGVYVSESDTDLGFPFFRVPYGQFRVESCPRDHQAMAHRKVQAYGNLSKLVKKSPFEQWKEGWTWEDNESYTVDVRKLVFANVGYYSPEILSQFSRTAISPDSYDFIATVTRVLKSSGGQIVDTEIYKITCTVKRFYLSYATDDCLAEILFNDFDYTPLVDGLNNFQDNSLYEVTKVVTSTATYNHNVRLSTILIQHPKMGDLRTNASVTLTHYKSLTDSIPCLYPFRGVNPGFRIEIPTEIKAEFQSSTMGRHGQDYDYSSAGADSFQVNKIIIPGSYGNITIKSTSFYKNTEYYLYYDSYKLVDILNGYLELNAQFGTAKRDGQFGVLQLDDSSPKTVSPELYENFWWDEYDVLPIGTVKYVFENSESESGEDENIASYEFGDGTSIYDMSDNKILKNLSDITAEDIEAMLDETFIPNLDPIAFTPIDLTMKGLPYLEAGDYLAVTAEDGTIAYSFAMRQTISGIQVLTAEIESTSGDIIESEEGET